MQGESREIPVVEGDAQNSDSVPAKPVGGDTWTPENIDALAQTFLPYVDRFLRLRESEQRHEMSVVQAATAHSRRTTTALLVFAGATIVVMSLLTWQGAVSGDALLFLVGTTMGALFMMVHRQLFEGGQAPPAEE